MAKQIYRKKRPICRVTCGWRELQFHLISYLGHYKWIKIKGNVSTLVLLDNEVLWERLQMINQDRQQVKFQEGFNINQLSQNFLEV